MTIAAIFKHFSTKTAFFHHIISCFFLLFVVQCIDYGKKRVFAVIITLIEKEGTMRV
jgi:hypothetical protein